MNKQKIFDIVELTRPQNMTRWILSFFIGYFFIRGSIIWSEVLIGIVVVATVHVFITVQNDIEDLEIDKVNAPNRPISSGRVSVQEAKYVLLVCIIIAITCSLVKFPTHFWFILLMLTISWLYNNKPFQLSRLPLLSIFSLSFLYSVLPISYGYFLQHQNFSNVYFIYAVMGWWVLRCSTSMLKDLRDTKGDKLFGKSTFVLVLGKQTTVKVSILLASISYLIIFCVLFLMHLSFWWLLPLGLGLWVIRSRYSLLGISDPKAQDKIFHNILNNQNRFDLIILICLLLLK